MQASRLISLLMEEVLSKGDGEVVFEYYSGDFLQIQYFETREDEDFDGKVTKRTFVLQNS